jgi:hypothetical protein
MIFFLTTVDTLNENDYHLKTITVKEQSMKQQTIVGQAMLPGHTVCKVLYNKAKDTVEVEVGGTSLKFEADSFIVMNEMFRKAAAKIVMQTDIVFSV